MNPLQSWLLANGLFAISFWYGILTPNYAVLYVVLAVTWVSNIAGLILTFLPNDKLTTEFLEIRLFPYKRELDFVFDLSMLASLIATGWYFTAFFYIFTTIGSQRLLYHKSTQTKETT